MSRNFVVFAAILGLSFAGNVFAADEMVSQETKVVEKTIPVVQSSDVAKDSTVKASEQLKKVKKVKKVKVNPVEPKVDAVATDTVKDAELVK